TLRRPSPPPAFSQAFASESVEKATKCIAEQAIPLNDSRYLRRMRKYAGQPCSRPSSWLSHLSTLANRLCTTRTTHLPPARASTIHSVATVGESGEPMDPSATKRLGASHAVILAGESIPGPKLATISPPWRSSLRVGTNHDEMPDPVAIAFQTSSGVPGTS